MSLSKQVLSMSSWGGRPFSHNRHGPKIGGCALLWRGMGFHLIQCRLHQGLPPCQDSSWSIQPFGHNTPTLQTDRQTDRQRTDSIGRTVYQRSPQNKMYWLQHWWPYDNHCCRSSFYTMEKRVLYILSLHDTVWRYVGLWHRLPS